MSKRASEQERARDGMRDTYGERDSDRGREGKRHVLGGEDHRAILYTLRPSLHYSLLFETAGLSAVCAPCIFP